MTTEPAPAPHPALTSPATLAARAAALDPARLRAMRRGIEREGLRALPSGTLALTPHPRALGSPLTHPTITTDFSESQLELITGVHDSVDACLDELASIHQEVLHALGDGDDAERMWAASMPCGLPTDETIPIARYGGSNIGRAKSVYRVGLGLRYGRRMQTISGVHYNWSLPGLSTPQYFALIRNVRRHAFLLLQLFGASPAVCACFVAGRVHELLPMAGTRGATLHLPHATSLRMGRLGYQSDAQSALAVSYNDLEGYAQSLHEALTQPYAPYEVLGIRNPGGEYNQLATTLLQIENEFYGLIRPKRVIASGERPLHALRQRGVEYVEVRCMDLDPFAPLGIAADTARFLDVFLLHCLLADSPPDTPAEIAALARNQQRTAARGREPGLALECGDEVVTLTQWAHAILDGCAPVADALDAALGGHAHRATVEAARAALDAPDTLPSARVLAQMTARHGGSHDGFGRAQSEAARGWIAQRPRDPASLARWAARAQRSSEDQRAIEAADREPFERWRQAYVSPSTLQPAAA